MSKSRWMLQTLILSVALNAVFLGTFFYLMIRDNPLQFSYRPKETVYSESPPLTQTLLGRLHSLSYKNLIELLKDQRKVQQGYRVCDFALGALASYHEFDVERGLSRRLSKRTWEMNEEKFILFPALKDKDFEVLCDFARYERWPFTTKGLLRCLQEESLEKTDPDLINFFCHTPHFVLLETLFARTNLPILKRSILALALECGWEPLEIFYNQQIARSDFSNQARQRFLLTAIDAGSQTAAYFLLLTDSQFAIQELNDEQIIKILDLLVAKTREAQQFVQLAINSPRGDSVREKAIERLAEYIGAYPKDFVGRFNEKPGLKELRPSFRQSPAPSQDPGVHIVQPGESLWLIAQKYHLSLEKLMEANHLQTTIIQPGKILKIPLAR